MSYTPTFKFKEIFPSYTLWGYFSRELGIEDPVFDFFCYNILSRFFRNQSIRYSSIDDFKDTLGNVYLNRFYAYKKVYYYVNKTYEITDTELIQLQEHVANFANNPNIVNQDPKGLLNYISQQTFSFQKGNKLHEYLRAINALPNYKIDQFIFGTDKNEINFNDLFINMQIELMPVYEKEEKK